MSSNNTYSAPQAPVADLGDAYDGAFQEMKAWAWRGRLGRLRFLAYGAVAYLICTVLTVTIGLAAGAFGANRVGSGLIGNVVWAPLIPYLVFVALVTIRRSHDMGWSGWMSLLAFLPLVGLVWIFKAGSSGANEYGAPPPPNTTGVKIAAFGIGVVMVLGILAAIAIPAYQQYAQRGAQVAQQVLSK